MREIEYNRLADEIIDILLSYIFQPIHEKLYNGRDNQVGEEADQGVWYASIVVRTSYSDEVIPYYFLQ